MWKDKTLRFVGLLGFFFISVHSICGQDMKDNIPLRFELRLESKRVCLSEPLIVHATIKNIGKDDVVIDAGQIGYSTSFLSVTEEDGGSGGEAFHSVGDNRGDYNPTFVVLSPGKTYTRRLSLILDREFFKLGRRYSLQIAYGQFKPQMYEGKKVWEGNLESDEAEFQLRTCRKTAR